MYEDDTGEKMKTDLYTKIILTIIAFALVLLCVETIYLAAIPQAKAKSGQWECWHLVDANASLSDHMNRTRFQPGTVFPLSVNTKTTKDGLSDTYCGWVQ